jgi:YARHG domain
MRYWRIWRVMRCGAYVKRTLLSGLIGVFAAIGFIPAVEAGAPLSEYSCDELWHERNSIYAGKGYCFKTARAIGVFGRGCFPPYGRLSGWESDRVAAIESWEYRKGCR